MRVVWKYEITNWGGTKIKLPPLYKILHFAWQGTGTKGNAHVWIEIEKGRAVSREVSFQIFGTGSDIPDGWKYIGTMQNDGLVWHCYYNEWTR